MSGKEKGDKTNLLFELDFFLCSTNENRQGAQSVPAQNGQNCRIYAGGLDFPGEICIMVANEIV